MGKNLTCTEDFFYWQNTFFLKAFVHIGTMLKIVVYFRYSNESIALDWHILLGALLFFILCGILIFQNQIWQEEPDSRNQKFYKWKSNAIKVNKGDLKGIYPIYKNNNFIFLFK